MVKQTPSAHIACDWAKWPCALNRDAVHYKRVANGGLARICTNIVQFLFGVF